MLVEMTGALLPSASDSWLCDANGMPDVRVLTPSDSGQDIVFHIPSANYGYAPYISSADGVKPPKYTSMTTNDANLRKKAKKKGIALVILRQKKYLAVEGYLV